MTSRATYFRSVHFRKDLRGIAAAILIGMFATLTGGCDSDSPTEPCTGPFQVGGEVSSPLKTFAPPPQYTDEARQARVQGVVIVQALIDCRGTVMDVTVVKELPLGLTEATVDAIRRWRFEPARLNGQAVSVFYNLSVNFRLD